MRSFDTAVSRTSDQHTANGRALLSVGFALLVVRACGVVYGDIGTSVLYTLREIFFGAHTYGLVPITRDSILGAVSLIFWALLLLITIKYIGFVLYADDHGEGRRVCALRAAQWRAVSWRGPGDRHAASGSRAVIWRWADYAS